MKAAATVLIAAASACLIFAATPASAQTRASCAADAKSQGLKGGERRAFMKSCVPARKGNPAQQEKMKACNAEFKAAGKPTSERRAFMRQCLKK